MFYAPGGDVTHQSQLGYGSILYIKQSYPKNIQYWISSNQSPYIQYCISTNHIHVFHFRKVVVLVKEEEEAFGFEIQVS